MVYTLSGLWLLRLLFCFAVLGIAWSGFKYCGEYEAELRLQNIPTFHGSRSGDAINAQINTAGMAEGEHLIRIKVEG